jgi:virginiamycin B lyase
MPVTGAPVEIVPLGGPDPQPNGITTGPDGRLWVALQNADAIAAVTTGGEVATYPLAGANIQPSLLTTSVGAVWYSGFNFGSVGRMTTNGSVAGFDLRTAILGVAPDDEGVWFAYYLNASMGRFDPTRGATLIPSAEGEVADIAVGDTYVVTPATLEGQGSLHRLVEATPLVPPLTPVVVPSTPLVPASPVPVTPAFTG